MGFKKQQLGDCPGEDFSFSILLLQQGLQTGIRTKKVPVETIMN